LKKVYLNGTKDGGAGVGHGGWLNTYYIYDAKGNLRCVLQPEGSRQYVGYIGSGNIPAALLNEQTFRYEYDSRNRITLKKVPGGDTCEYVYDSRDRLIMKRDAYLRSQNVWLVNRYDNLNRLAPFASIKVVMYTFM
jgi:YD repeat-containing protein